MKYQVPPRAAMEGGQRWVKQKVTFPSVAGFALYPGSPNLDQDEKLRL